MKITKAKIYLGNINGRRPVLLQLFTDAGITGTGQAAIDYGIGSTAAAGMMKDMIEIVILGQDPFRTEALWSQMYDDSFWAQGGGPIVFAGMSAIEQALFDIKGKALGVPIYELLGGKFRDKARVYANGWSFRSYTPDEFARSAEKVVADGFDALKLYPLAMPITSDSDGRIQHVSLRHIDRDAERLAVERVRAVRDAVGWDVDILVDMSAELTTDAIIRIGQQLEELKLFFLEEPVDPFDVGALKKVSEHVSIPIAVGERLYTRYGFREVMERHAADILQPDIGNTGGFMETKKIAAMAEVYNMKIQPHHAGVTPVSTAAAMQLAACIPNLSIVETYPYRPTEHYDTVDHAPEYEREGSTIPISDRPGLGVELAEERVAPFLWAECELG